ncbi:MCE family protein [Nocardioides caeni]|uniref:MCE family protein n=1 Tax=Nocardioides caeni TaxID=574700 RepID=A0A4V4HJ55_9ACTN|nr:MCE family protein [Nocardioides caeni]THV09136.1 MCE family protein [Nocardioides caeni]
MTSIWGPLVKLSVYTVTIFVATALLLMVIVNGRTGESETFHAVFEDASCVAPNDNVKIAGVTAGKVSDVRVVDRNRAEDEFTLDKGIELPETVRIEIEYENLIGDRYLDLQRPQQPEAPALEPGSTIGLDRTKPALNLTVLFGGFKPLFQALEPDQVNRFAEDVLQTLQGERGTVDQLVQQTASLTNTIADRDTVIGQLVDDLNVVLGTVSSRDSELSSLLLQLQRFVTGLSEDRDVIGPAITSISQLTQSVAGLLVDARGPLEDDIVALGELATHLDRGKGAIADELAVIPQLLGRINRTASYGSWFQFYLCDMGGSLTSGGGRTGITAYSNTAERCSR